MKVSVSVLAFNHAKFIRQALDSVLMQKTNFDFEIVIGEDDSNDGTRDIVKEYQAKHPQKIRLILNDRKNVIFIDGRPTGRWNFINNLQNCHGQYVAMLDGDDYWISADKLQKQVDFLDHHPECAMCSHDVMLLQNDGSQQRFGFKLKEPSFDITDLLRWKFIPQTCSVMYRNRLFDKFPDWFSKVFVGDFPLHVLNAQFGRVGHLAEALGVYRIHSGGVWSGLKDGEAIIKSKKKMVELHQTLDEALGFKYHDAVAERLARLNFEIARCYAGMKNRPEARAYLKQAFQARPVSLPTRTLMALKLWTVGLRSSAPP